MDASRHRPGPLSSRAEESIPAPQNCHHLPGKKVQPCENGDIIKRTEGVREGGEREEDKAIEEREGDEGSCGGGETEGEHSAAPIHSGE